MSNVGVMTSARTILLAAWCLLTACSSPVDPSATTSPTAISPLVTPSAAAHESPTIAPTPIPTAGEPSLAVDSFAEVVTTDLVVRSAPGTGPGSEIHGTIGDVAVYVLDGPVQADGYEWWLVVPRGFDQLEPPPSGWVAAGGQEEVWLAPTRVRCQETPASDVLWAMSSIRWVGCYSGVELALRGMLSGCAAAAGPAWDHGCFLRDCLPEVCERLFDDRGVIVHFDSLPNRTKAESSSRATSMIRSPRAAARRGIASPSSAAGSISSQRHTVSRTSPWRPHQDRT